MTPENIKKPVCFQILLLYTILQSHKFWYDNLILNHDVTRNSIIWMHVLSNVGSPVQF